MSNAYCRTIIVGLLIALAGISTVTGQTYQLKDALTGAASAPFKLDPGSPVVLGGRTFELIRIDDPEAVELEAHLRNWRLPELSLEDARLDDAIQFLAAASKPVGNRYYVPAGINFRQVHDEFAQIGTVTLSVSDLPFYEVIRFVCEEAGATFTVEGNVVVIRSRLSAEAETTKARLEEWIIPELSFENASIKDVLDFLLATSRELDRPGGIGVGMIYMGKQGGDASTPANDNGFSDFGGELQSIDDKVVDAINLSLQRVSMLDAIRSISRNAGVRFTIDAQGVINIEPAD